MMHSLKLIDAERKLTAPVNQRAISFKDFEVSGVSLYSELVSRGFDYVSCLGWVGADYELEARARLMLKSPGEMSKGRVGIYVCSECVDPYCGAITAEIYQEDGKVIWSELAYDNFMEDDPEFFVFKLIEGLGPYIFDKSEYLSVFS